ncbi:MAG: hypothetical protein EAZ24_07930 [Burkholderiales bacterium]|nr:MAG: hypothetical protein EAZ24_07930 [Burkholderiales bacterium]TAG77157.1 MAG: hypothetical protein EAZ21_15375 [Betaproteobacteria bacterium]
MPSYACLGWRSLCAGVAFGVCACALEVPGNACERGYKFAYDGVFAEAQDHLDACLSGASSDLHQRRRALIAMGWAKSNLDDDSGASAAYDAAFQIAPVSDYAEMINASMSYKHAQRHADALKLNIAAANWENGKYAQSMMTQYHLGWSYQLNGLHEKAVEAFDKAIPHQPDFAYAYWRRAVSHEAMGNAGKAKTDLNVASSLFVDSESGRPLKLSIRAMHQEIAETYKRHGLSVPIAVNRTLSK